jgi:hypothetical protein
MNWRISLRSMSQIMDRLYIIDDNRQKYHSSSYLLISDKKKSKDKARPSPTQSLPASNRLATVTEISTCQADRCSRCGRSPGTPTAGLR